MSSKKIKVAIATIIQILMVIFWLCLWKVPAVQEFVNKYSWLKISSYLLFALSIVMTIEYKPSNK